MCVSGVVYFFLCLLVLKKEKKHRGFLYVELVSEIALLNRHYLRVFSLKNPAQNEFISTECVNVSSGKKI